MTGRAIAALLVAVACLSGCAAVPLEAAQNGSDWSFRLVADADEKISGSEKGIPCQLERVQHVEADMRCQPTTGLPHPVPICRGSGKASYRHALQVGVSDTRISTGAYEGGLDYQLQLQFYEEPPSYSANAGVHVPGTYVSTKSDVSSQGTETGYVSAGVFNQRADRNAASIDYDSEQPPDGTWSVLAAAEGLLRCIGSATGTRHLSISLRKV